MSQIVNNRELKIYTCYEKNIPPKVISYQKRVFDMFDMELEQELSNIHHPDYLTNKINSENFDIMVFFDIDCIPLKPGLYEYIVSQISDNNTLIGVEQAANHIDGNIKYAGPACFAISKIAYEKLGYPSFRISKLADTGGELTIAAKEKGVKVKYFKITSSLNKKWKCGKKRFGNGTIYDDWLYHQFEIRYDGFQGKLCEYQFITKCKEILEKYENIVY